MNAVSDGHWFWLLVTIVVMAWYSFVTIYVAVRGAFDIRSMMLRLKAAHLKQSQRRKT